MPASLTGVLKGPKRKKKSGITRRRLSNVQLSLEQAARNEDVARQTGEMLESSSDDRTEDDDDLERMFKTCDQDVRQWKSYFTLTCGLLGVASNRLNNDVMGCYYRSCPYKGHRKKRVGRPDTEYFHTPACFGYVIARNPHGGETVMLAAVNKQPAPPDSFLIHFVLFANWDERRHMWVYALDDIGEAQTPQWFHDERIAPSRPWQHDRWKAVTNMRDALFGNRSVLMLVWPIQVLAKDVYHLNYEGDLKQRSDLIRKPVRRRRSEAIHLREGYVNRR